MVSQESLDEVEGVQQWHEKKESLESCKHDFIEEFERNAKNVRNVFWNGMDFWCYFGDMADLVFCVLSVEWQDHIKTQTTRTVSMLNIMHQRHIEARVETMMADMLKEIFYGAIKNPSRRGPTE